MHKMGWLLSHGQSQAGSRVDEQCIGRKKRQKIRYQCPRRHFEQPNDSHSMKWVSFNLYCCSQSSLFTRGMEDTIFSAYTQLNLPNGIHVGAIFYVGMEGCLHHLQESGVTAKGNDPTPQAREIDNFSSWISIAASNTWAVKILWRFPSRARKFHVFMKSSFLLSRVTVCC